MDGLFLIHVNTSDHLYAIKTIAEVHESGGKIKSFLSYCGGLPAPEASDNPLGYKFSWSARGMLLALGNTARFLEDGKTREIVSDKFVITFAAYELSSRSNPYLSQPSHLIRQKKSIWNLQLSRLHILFFPRRVCCNFCFCIA